MLKVYLCCLLSIGVFKEAYGRHLNGGEAQCDNSFFPLETHENNSRQYYFGIIYKGNYFQAIQFCNYHHMKLLSIETAEENNFIFNILAILIGTGQYSFWTSGTLLPENHWVWLSTGKPIVHATWTNHPSNKSRNCLEIKYGKTSKTLVWTDADCNATRHFICETNKTHKEVVTPS